MNAFADTTTLRQPDVSALPSARQLARRLAVCILLAGGAVALISALPGLREVPRHLAGADLAWMAVAAALQIASRACFALAFHGTYERRVPRRTSAGLSMAVQGLNIMLPSGGSGGIAVGAVVLDRAGVPRRFAVSRSVALFLLTSLVTFVAIVIAGLGVATGLLPGDVTLAASLVPALGALLVIAALPVLPRLLPRRAGDDRGRLRRTLSTAGVHLHDGVASSIALVRSRDPLVIGGSIGYFAFDVAALAAAFHALGAPGLPVGLFVLAYTLGHGGAMIPLPGSAEGGLIGMFVLYGTPLPAATAAVLAYRVVHAGVPTLLGIAGVADVRRTLRSPGGLSEPDATRS
jgi:uncharacterized membrane protein YbhN (UPF0104 family)